MKVTYVGNTERNGEKRKVTYTGTLGPSAAQDKRGPKATYVGVDTSKGSSDGVAWHTDKALLQANKEYFAGKKNENQSGFSRAGKTVIGGLKGSLAGNMDAMGVAYQAGQGGRTQRNTAALKDAQWAVSRAKYAYDTDKTPASAAELNNALKQLKAYADVLGDGAYEQALKAAYDASGRIGTDDLNKLYESLGKVNVDTSTGVQQKATKASRDLALQVQQSGIRDIEAAKEGVGTFGQMVIDTGASMAQMGGDLVVNALLSTPGSMMPFATRAFGGATMQAREGGGDLKQQIAYGAVQAGKEVLTEKMFNMALPFAKAYGGGALDDVTQRAIQTAVDKLGKTAAGKRALNAAFQLTASGVGEGLEELIGDWMEWQMPRIYGGDVDTAGETLANSLYDFVVGGMAGVAGSVISPDTYSYGRYAADVQQNTAPEINTKAAEAVEAVTRGEAITGNQAAAIARDPVAVEVLEQRTGVKLDTDKPISQVKRDIAGLASRKVTQETQRATPPSPSAQKRAEKRVGGFLENGQKAYQEMSRTAEDAPSLYAGFSSVYNAGLNGIEADKAKGKYAAMLTPEQRYAAYNAGLEDARVQLARENAEVASVTTTAGAGLADNEYSRGLIAVKKDTAATLNAWGKKLGVRIEIVDQVLGGRANGQYIKEQNLIQIAADSDKPLLNVTAHEITHRMQDLSPAEYRKFRQAAVAYKMQENGADTEAEIVERYMEAAEQEGVTLTRDEVMDELAADFAGDMLDDADLFAKFSKENRTAAQKLLDSLKEFLAKVRGLFTGKYRDMAAQEAYGKDFAELEDIAKQWQAAFDAAERQAGISSSVRPGDTVQYDDAVYSLRVTDKDTLDFLDKQKTITTYKTMQLVDGKLYPPMAARVDGHYEDASELGKWEMAVERPDLVKDGKFKLDKGKGQGSLMAAYNPYMHSSNLVLNDQFSGAYTRDNLVTVECEVPASEMTSGYHADGAKDSVGWHSWHTGTVAGQVRKATGMERQVFLSRWIKPVRILSNAEVAGMYKELLGNTGIAVPDNVVTPGLLAELKKAGVSIKESGRVKAAAGEGDGVRFSLKQTRDGRNYVMVENAMTNAELKNYQTIANYIAQNIGAVYTIIESGQRVYIGKDLPNEYTHSKYTQRIANSAKQRAKNRAVSNLGEMVEIATNRRWEKTRHPNNKDAAYGMYRYDTTFAFPVKGENGVYRAYDAELLIRNASDGRKYLYDIVSIKENTGLALDLNQKARGRQNAATQSGASGTSILTDGENVKPQFSLKAPVEETKNLLALHNLTEKNLLDAAKLGGLPMPSIAIVKADEGHGEYGDISFVFSKDTIDPQLFRSNKVYGYDAWTPTAPQIEYEVNEKSAKKIHDLFYRMERAKGRSFADPLYSAANTLEDELNRKGGVDKVVGAMRDDPRVMNIYLEDTGRGAVDNVIKREVTRMDDNQQEMASFLIRELGDGVVNDFRPKGNESPVAARKLWYKDHGEALNAALQKYYEKLGLPAKDAADVVNAETVAAKTRYMLDARKYLAGNTETVTEEVDRDATNKAIRDKVNQKEYEQWLDDLFDGVVKNEGIYNGKDYYTSSGNRRSFSATHYEITLENIVKAMKQGDQKGANTFFGGQAIWGVASKDYGSIDEIKADSGRLQKMTEEEYSAIRQKYSERLAELTNEIKDPAARNEFIASDDAASAIVETLRTKRTVEAIDKELRTYPTLHIKPDTAEKVLRLAQDISNMPTGYFEAKPQRAVGFDEVLAAVIPNDAGAEVKAALENAGVRMIEYASGDEKARLDAVNSVENARFSLKATAEVEREARELKKERNALAKQNEALKQRVQELKGEMRISKEPSVMARDVKKLGLNLIREYGSDVKYADVQSEMDALAKAVMKRDVTMKDLMPHAKAVAEAIVDNTSELTEYGAELLEIRDHLKRQTIQFSGDMANYGDFRKSHMGTLKLNKDNGTSVDTVYGELTEMFGEGYFPSDVHTEADKLLQIGDVLDGLDSVYHNPFEGYRDAAVQEIANQLIDGMISDQVRQKKTYADRRALEKQEAVGRVREMLSRERQKRRDDVNALRKKYNEKTKKGSEKRKATAMRARIARHTGAISRKLVNPTDKQHIPERLRVAVASLLQNINLESAYSYDENGRLRKNADGDPTRRTLEADRLKQIYDDILDNEGNMVVDPALTESGGLLDSLSALGGKRIADMSVSELETVWNAIRAIETTLTTYDKTLSSAKYKSTSEWAERFAADSMGRKRRNRKISLDMADPYTFFSAYGDAGKQLYRTLRNAQDQQHWMLRDVQREAEKFLDKNVYKNRFDRHTFTTGRGVELTLTTDQIMNLYNLARRGEQAMHHLTVGGIVQPEIKRNGKLKEIPRGNDNILLTEEDIKAITSVLTPEQVKVANGLQKLASTKLAEWGNNASMQVYGYRKFKEEHYWPIKAAKDAVASSVEKDADNARSIKNMGSAKALTPNASNALDIGGAYDVFAQNASDMIKYATLLAPMEDINRLYNYRYRDSSGNLTGRNMQQVLSGVYGDAAQKYWRNLMRDMQNGMVKNSSDTTRSIERIVGNTKGAAVGSNWRVVIQQPTAFFRAAVILDPENMAKGIAKGVTAGNGWDKARNWAAIAGIKDSSGFDQGSRYTIAREVYGSSDSVMDKLSDWSSRAAANADAITWGKIWNACEWQVAADTKTEVGSDAYYRQVAELFTDVIDQTQVVDGIMQRTQIMRDSDALTRQATSFMGEPLKSLNILMRSYDAWRFETNTQKRSAALKQLKRSVGALLVTDIINSLAQSLVDALRDDDKEKKYWARFFAELTGVSGDEESFGELAKNVLLEGNLKGNITLVGRLPYAKDLISILQGYSVERMDADAIGDIVRATQTMYSSVTGEGKYTTAYACKQLLTAVSKIFGVSVANLGRDVWAAARSAANETGNVRIMFEMEKAIYGMDRSAGNRKRWCELLYLAQKESDTKTARMIYKEMLEHGYDEKDVQQGVETIMKAEQNVKSVKELKNRWRAP